MKFNSNNAHWKEGDYRCSVSGRFLSKGSAAISHSRVYKSWTDMMMRCTNPKNKRWKDYGGRGIRVCERWRVARNFCLDMGERPEGMTLDRIDNDGNYEPANCRWASRVRQQNNKRSNRVISYEGTTLTCTEWARRLGIDVSTLSKRINRSGWTVERALTTPPIEPRMRNAV